MQNLQDQEEAIEEPPGGVGPDHLPALKEGRVQNPRRRRPVVRLQSQSQADRDEAEFPEKQKLCAFAPDPFSVDVPGISIHSEKRIKKGGLWSFLSLETGRYINLRN